MFLQVKLVSMEREQHENGMVSLLSLFCRLFSLLRIKKVQRTYISVKLLRYQRALPCCELNKIFYGYALHSKSYVYWQRSLCMLPQATIS